MEHQPRAIFTNITQAQNIHEIGMLFDLKTSSARIQQIIRENQELKQQNQLQARIIQNLQNQLSQAHLLTQLQQQKHRSLSQSEELKIKMMNETYQVTKYQHQIMISQVKKLKQKLANCNEQNIQLRYQLAELSKLNQSTQFQIQKQSVLIESVEKELNTHLQLISCLKIENQQLKSTNSKIIYENELANMKLQCNEAKTAELEQTLSKMLNKSNRWKQQSEQMSRKYNDLAETVELIDEMRRTVRRNKINL